MTTRGAPLMKAKVGRGSGFRGVIEYALQTSKGASIIGGTMTSTTPRALAAEFAVSRQQRTEINRPVWHCSLSLPQSDDLDEQRWHDVARDFMAEVGMSGHQYIVVRHADTEHDHVHIIASRVGLDASVWYGRWEARQVIEATQRLEIRHGLTTTPGLDATRERKAPTKNEIEQADRVGASPVRQRLQRLIDAAIADGPSVTALCERLEFEGVEVKANIASTGKLNGLSFSLDGIAFKGSQLGKAYTWSQLQKKGVTYEPDTEYRALSGRGNSASRRADSEHSPAAGGADEGSGAVADADAGVGDGSAGRDAALDERDDLERRSGDASPAPIVIGDGQPDAVSDERGADSDERAESGDRASGIEPDGVDEAAREVSHEHHGSDRGIEGSGQSLREQGDGRSPTIGARDEPSDERGWESQVSRESGRGSDQRENRGAGTGSKPDALDADRGRAAERVRRWRGAVGAISDLAAGRGGGDLQSVSPDMMTPAQQAKVAAWRQQSAALNAPQYRITFTPRREHLKPRNHGKGKGPDGGERFYTADEVEALIPYMSRQNWRGYDIYVTPIDDHHHYLVVDDMTAESHARLIKAGYQPALVQESSANNRQAVLKAPRTDGPDEQKAANRVVQRLNKEIGDPEFSGAVHPFRMAGFSNKKEGKQNAFTKIIEAAGVICQRTVERLQQARDRILDQRDTARRDERLSAISAAREPRRNAIHESTRDPVQEYRWRAKNQPSDADWSGVDFGIAVGMLKAGWRPDRVEAAIIEASPGLADRHRDPQDYARRTVENAADARRPQRDPGPKQDPGLSM